jgi:LuxR family transcriptional regulator, maltose regulon positive regulatory protein
MNFPLLATRFFMPRLPAACVPRPRLMNHLEKIMQVPVVLVSAPPGFGKSSLLSEWIHNRAGLHIAWLSLESSDQDWGLFFRYLIAAWQHIFPKAGEAALAEMNAFPSQAKEALTNMLLNDLLAGQDSTGADHSVLVLDDYHLIDSAAIHDSVAYLIEHLPPFCHLVLLTRSNPPLPVARWRSRGQILEVRADDLRFTADEAAEYLNQTMQLQLNTEQIEILQARTEGWIVGLQMAALSMQGRKDVREFVHDFGGSNRFVIDYLVEEVLNRQSDEVQQFLLTTAPLERFCSSLCDAMLDVPAPYSQSILETLEKANLFLIPLDDHRHWFRYHHLFGDLLCVRVQQNGAELLPALYRRATVWLSQNGLWHDAIRYAILAKDFELGANLFEQAIRTGGRSFLWESGIRTLIEPFPGPLVQTRPLLSWAKAIGMLESSQLAGIEPLVRYAEKGIRSAQTFKGQDEILGWMYVVQSNIASLLGDSAWIIEASRQVALLIPDNAEANADALFHVGNVYYYEGDLNQTDACWQGALALSQANGYTLGMLFTLANLGRLCAHKGDLKRAEEYFERALVLSAEAQNIYLRWIGSVQRDTSDVLRERNYLAEAHTLMTASLALCEKWESISGTGLGYLHLGRILLAEGDFQGAATLLQKAEELCRAHTVYPDLETLVQVFHARLDLAMGQADQAWQVLEKCLKSPCCHHELHREWVLIAQARVLQHTRRPTEALALLAGRLESAKEKGRGRNWLEISLLTALALKAIGDPQQAGLVLKEGLVYAQNQGFRRIFVDEGEPMRELLEEFRVLFPQTQLSDFVGEILAIYPALSVAENIPSTKVKGLFEPLSGREMEILRLLSQGFSNAEIAARLVLSVGTVKTHIHNIYGKLGVRDRPQAIAKAGLLGL